MWTLDVYIGQVVVPTGEQGSHARLGQAGHALQDAESGLPVFLHEASVIGGGYPGLLGPLDSVSRVGQYLSAAFGRGSRSST